MSCTRTATSYRTEEICCDQLSKEKIEEIEKAISNMLVDKFSKISAVKQNASAVYYHNGVIAIEGTNETLKNIGEAFGLQVKEVGGYTLCIDPILDAVKKFGLNLNEKDIMASIGAIPATEEVKKLIESNIRKVKYNSSYAGIVNNARANGVYKTTNNVKVTKTYEDNRLIHTHEENSIDANDVNKEIDNVLANLQEVTNHIYDNMGQGVTELLKVRAETLGYQVEEVYNEEEEQVQLVLTRLD